jgi:transposase-like protein
MSRRATPIVLTIEERREVQRRVRARTSSQQAAQRARIVLRAAEGARNIDIAAELGIARHTAQQWRDRFAASRLAGLEDHPPPREYGAERQARILVVACQSPAELGWSGQTHWSVRDLAQYLREHPEVGVGRPSKSTVGKILQAAEIRLERL